eukprot:1195405-Prorocentrum_minimum.AAC.2
MGQVHVIQRRAARRPPLRPVRVQRQQPPALPSPPPLALDPLLALVMMPHHYIMGGGVGGQHPPLEASHRAHPLAFQHDLPR